MTDDNLKLKVAAISRIRTVTDGEGVTTLVVSMGCPLRCAYCLNPITWDGTYNNFVKEYTLDDLYNEFKIDDLYFLATGGGIMFGGGEPLLNYKFIKAFIEKYKDTGWKFNMETSLNVPIEYLKEVVDLIDFFIVDTKDMNKERYELYTKGDYERFLNNLKFLLDKAGSDKIKARVPIIPKFHKDKEYEENSKMLKGMGIENIEIFQYIMPELRKKVSKEAFENREDFLSSLE